MPATRARERQLRQQLAAERGEHLDDDAFLAAVFELALGATDGEHGVGDRARAQVVMYRCEGCGAGKQLGGGVMFDVDEADVERAECDAERASALTPERATQDIPKKVRRFVELRDGKRCRIPGCRSARFLEVHHIVHREHGGTHDPENLIVTCDGHHTAHHRGALWIVGTASALVVRRADERGSAHVGALLGERTVEQARGPAAEQAEQAANRMTAVCALTTLGWKPKTAAAAVDAALAESGPEVELDPLIRAALQRCR